MPVGEATVVVREQSIQEVRQKVAVEEGKSSKVLLYASRSATQLQEIVVKERKEPEQVARHEITHEEAVSVPGTGNDAIKAVENMPGVTNTGPVTPGGLVIRNRGTANTTSTRSASPSCSTSSPLFR